MDLRMPARVVSVTIDRFGGRGEGWPLGRRDRRGILLHRVTGHVRIEQRKRGEVFYLKYRLADGRQVQKRLGPRWTERGRPPAGHYTDRTADEALQELLADARRGTLAGAEPRAGKTFEDACAEHERY
jgi:hypothetical protein